MANLGFCKNCKKMEKLSFLDTCKKCKGEIVVGTKISDSEWNNKTQAEKDSFLYGIDGLFNYGEAPHKQVNENIGPFEGQEIVYSIEGVRGRHIDIYQDKAVLSTKVTLGSIITQNASDGEKTIYYSDCIGIQFKPSKVKIGYLQLETASSSGNNRSSNFFNENSFTFDTTVISNEKMEEVVNFVKKRIDEIKKGNHSHASAPAQNNTNLPLIADELLKLKQLVDMGVLTQEEFDAKKKQLLGL